MSPADLLADLHARGVAVSADGDDLLVTAPRGVLSADMRATIARFKPVLLAHLTQERPQTGNSIDNIDNNRAPDSETLRLHLDILYPTILEGCRLGLHKYLGRVPAEVVRSILAAAGPDTDPVTFSTLCRSAGDAACLAAAIDEYRYRLRLLRPRNPDVAFRYAAELELCLAHEVDGS